MYPNHQRVVHIGLVYIKKEESSKDGFDQLYFVITHILESYSTQLILHVNFSK